MRKRFLLGAAMVAAMLAAGPAAAAEAGFLDEYQDLPLAPGLAQAPGGLVFDTPGGRIVEGYAEGRVDRAAVLAFYGDTLPQLGWERTGTAGFRREGELLRLEFSEEGEQLVVHFVVTPAGTE